MTDGKALPALFAVLALGMISALAPGEAYALISNEYYCPNKASHQWCDGRASNTYGGIHSWDWNEVEYTGSGSVYVCERIWRPSTGQVLGGVPGCGWNWTGKYYGVVTCVCYEAEGMQTSGVPRTFTGFSIAY